MKAVQQIHKMAVSDPAFRRLVDRVAKRASAVIVGDIFVSSWGYDQVNVDFYQVVKTTPQSVVLRKIDKRLVKGRGEPTEYYTAVANKFVDRPFRRKLQDYRGPFVKINSYAIATKWDGKPAQQTGAAYGH